MHTLCHHIVFLPSAALVSITVPHVSGVERVAQGVLDGVQRPPLIGRGLRMEWIIQPSKECTVSLARDVPPIYLLHDRGLDWISNELTIHIVISKRRFPSRPLALPGHLHHAHAYALAQLFAFPLRHR